MGGGLGVVVIADAAVGEARAAAAVAARGVRAVGGAGAAVEAERARAESVVQELVELLLVQRALAQHERLRDRVVICARGARRA